jgi:hypothetical protein
MYKSAFQIALDRELFYQRVAGWAIDVEIAIQVSTEMEMIGVVEADLQDAYGADLDTLVEMEWKNLLKDPSYKTETDIQDPVIHKIEVAIRAADEEIQYIKKERKRTKGEALKTRGRDWKEVNLSLTQQ